MTLLPEALVVPGSEPGRTARPHVEDAPDDLICPAHEIFNAEQVAPALAKVLSEAEDAMAARRGVVQVLTEARKAGRDAIAEAFATRPFAARPVTRSYAWLTDRLVIAALDAARSMHPLANPTEGEKLALLAVGGYGRGEMAPHSDVDLLFLTPWKITPWAESVIESMLYMLWDLKLKVGHSSRTVKDCLRLAKDDYTIRTSLVECRQISGDPELGEALRDRLWDELFRNTAADFIEAKLSERDLRHEKQGGQRYVVEPNVKEG